MNVRFLRVLSIRANGPGVVAFVDGVLVKWNPKRGWITDCDCDDECLHVDVVADLLDNRVTGEPA